MSEAKFEPPAYQRLVDEIGARLVEEEAGAVLTALTVLLGNAGYWYEMEFDEFIDYVKRNTYLVYRDQKLEEEYSVVH